MLLKKKYVIWKIFGKQNIYTPVEYEFDSVSQNYIYEADSSYYSKNLLSEDDLFQKYNDQFNKPSVELIDNYELFKKWLEENQTSKNNSPSEEEEDTVQFYAVEEDDNDEFLDTISVDTVGESDATDDKQTSTPTLFGPKDLKQSLEEIKDRFRTALESPSTTLSLSSVRPNKFPDQEFTALEKKTPLKHAKGKAPLPPTMHITEGRRSSMFDHLDSKSKTTSRTPSPSNIETKPEKKPKKSATQLLKNYMPYIFRSSTNNLNLSESELSSTSNSQLEYRRETEI